MFPYFHISKTTEPRVAITVMFWTLIVVLVGAAIFCWWAAYSIERQPAPDVAMIALAHRTGRWCVGVVVILFALRFVIRKKLDD